MQDIRAERAKGATHLTLYSLLAKGCFPRELPPGFSTAAFATAVCGEVMTRAPSGAAEAAPWALAAHTIPRLDGSRRVLGLPNPVGFAALAGLLSRGWHSLAAFYARSRFAAAMPTAHTSAERALITRFSPRARQQSGQTRARRGRYLLRADIERCSDSVEHALLARVESSLSPTRARAAEDFLAGQASRLQQGVARGLPVGPDTTLAMLELMLTAVDIRLEAECPALTGLRRCDNYEFDCASADQAAAVRELLRAVLGEHGFGLHPHKTSVVEYAGTLMPGWMERLGDLPLRADALISDLPGFADAALELIGAHPGEPVADRALARLHEVEPGPSELSLLRVARVRIAAAAPSALRFALHLLLAERQRGLPTDRSWLERELYMLIERHAARGDASEVAWALWTALEFDVRLHAVSAAAVSRMHDDVVALLALEAESRGLIAGALDTSGWAALLGEHALCGAHWLLAYEAAAHGWLGDASGVRAVKDDRDFGPLLRAGVRLFDAAPPATAA